MKIVVGLGNPGSRYAGTRHNVGFMVLDRLAERAGFHGRARDRDGAAVLRGRLGEHEVALVKPLTWMNESGHAVRRVLARERAPLADLLVVVDDLALPLGRLRLRAQGSAGGHNGLRSIVAELGTQRFARLRVGIGEPSADAVDHVLSRFGAAERTVLEAVLDAAAEAVSAWVADGAERTANRWNTWRPDVQLAPTSATVEPPGSGTPGAEGIVRSPTGWRRVLRRGPPGEAGPVPGPYRDRR